MSDTVIQSTSSSNALCTSQRPESKWQSFKDSFKPVVVDMSDVDPNLTEYERAAIRTSRSPLSKKLRGRHLQMIAIGGSIGTGLFVGSGGALRTGGPASLLIGWGIIGTMMYSTIQGLGELAVAFPISGGFNAYATRFLEPSIGFAVAWNYFMQFAVLLPLELVAASITIKFWNTTVNPDVWVLIFFLMVVAINLFGVKGYGESEFVFSIIKVIAVVGFIILGIVLIGGGGPQGQYVGDKYWHDPGAFANGFKGVCSVFVTAAFSFGGTEMIGLTAAETKEPHKTLPTAIKQVFWRITLFYIVSLIIISFLVPYNDTSLIGASSVDAVASPFVIAIKNGGVKGLPSVINVVILISVLSVGNTSVYATSRTMVALAEQNQAPKICGYVDRAGRPLVAIMITNVFGMIAFCAASEKQVEVFNWLLALSGLSSIFTWASINASHIRFRAALYHQNRGVDELSFVSQTGVWGSWYGLVMNALVLVAQFWIALFPIGSSPNASDFFMSYLGLPVILASWIGHKIWKKNFKVLLRSDEINIDAGRRDIDMDLLKQEIAEEKEVLASKPLYVKIYKWWC
ncbi:hypothetical protein BABINDRAFT_38465 [Babjeviella inositovora NRRL Y-12698]|uniref:Amino acid permease/ SLC12A domain-containing protein n=1 Tax=Babjeviella inositovora NRRL Y-12698 TaxID=984486 RepID=A0A1E3QLT9_9ASCO|nr:uncharacterized protein BABINDRAFT_38465 [Babjeviella inositovora NRRL Y-12698]ODQ78651.1 hypothetical protein BABINDRAFT_38465 [Babjeviella inositovora NRRL Y-12698]